MLRILKNNSFIKDFGWYFLGSFLPLLIGLVKTPIFTRHYSQLDYGYLGLIAITFSFVGIVLFSWLTSCLWRYYSKFEKENRLKILYSNLLFLFTISSILLLVISVIWYFISDITLVKNIIFFSFFHVLFSQCILFYLVIIRLKEKAFFYTIFNIIRSVLGVFVALIMVFIYKMDISALILSLAIIDGLAVLVLLVLNPVKMSVRRANIEIKEIKEFLIYGSSSLILNLSLLAISYSDRYFIAFIDSVENVGVYDQGYKLSQLSIVALMTVFFNTVNPKLLKELEVDFANSIILIQYYLKIILLFGLPIILYLIFLSKDISYIFLGEKFRESYKIMPYIFIASYLHGISNFFELRLKFLNKLKRLSVIIIFVALVNIVLNYFLISLYGFKWAAISTMISYILLIMLFHFFDRKVFLFSFDDLKLIFKVISVLLFQIVIFYSILDVYSLDIRAKIILIMLFAIVYLILLKKHFSSIFNFK